MSDFRVSSHVMSVCRLNISYNLPSIQFVASDSDISCHSLFYFVLFCVLIYS